jgi:methionine aminopeptidase
VCGTVDTFIDAELLKVFSNKKSKKLERGIAFPTCLSVNEICGHYSPCADESQALANEDLVKIELGAHIDGYTANLAHTLIVGGKAKDKKAAVTLAAYDAFTAATKVIKSGSFNHEVTTAIQKVCEQYEVEPL